jgi:predicted acyltransferase (DUF342 family)
VPVDADELEVQRVRSEAVASWFDEIHEKRLAPLDAPATELIDEDVVRINGRVVITQSWRVWGPVRVGDAEG